MGVSAFQQPVCNFFLLLILLLLISPPAGGRRSSLPKHALDRASVEAAQQTDYRSDSLHPERQTDRHRDAADYTVPLPSYAKAGGKLRTADGVRDCE